MLGETVMSRDPQAPAKASIESSPPIRAAGLHANPQEGDLAKTAALQEGLADALIAIHRRLAATAPERDKKRDAWDIAGLIAGWTAALIIPVVLGVTGYYLSIILKNREAQTKMVELAIDLLKVDPKPTNEDKALRNWAMDVIDKYSEVKLPAEVRSNLQSQPLEVASPLEGSATAPALKALNRLKNRSLLPNESDVDKEVTLEKLLEPGDDFDRFDQAKAVTITGFAISVKLSSPTTANFRSTNADDRDTHIQLASKKDATANQQLIAIVTPRLRKQMREKSVDWTTNALRDLIVGKRVKITGWLLFNTAHANQAENRNPGNPRNWRATAWEIHPVTSIEVIDEQP
jgi:hypothetical protein